MTDPGPVGAGSALADALPGGRILVTGDAMLDRYMHGGVERISPEAPVPVVRLEGTDEAPGGAANVAAGVAALGARCRLVAPVGDDDAGRTLGRLLDDAGVGTSDLVATDDRPTTVKTRVIGRGRQMLRVDRESRDRLEGGAAGRMLSAAREATAEADAVVLADYGKGALAEELVRGVIGVASERDVPVVADPSPGRLDRFRGVRVLTPNRAEAGEALAADGPGGSDASGEGDLPAEDDLRELRRRLGVRYLLVTLGEEGMCLAGPGGEFDRFAAETVEVYDVTGAGDTVSAVVATALAAGAEPADAARLANQAAALTVQKLGARPVSLEELRAAAS